jgi:hypothetical protein
VKRFPDGDSRDSVGDSGHAAGGEVPIMWDAGGARAGDGLSYLFPLTGCDGVPHLFIISAHDESEIKTDQSVPRSP